MRKFAVLTCAIAAACALSVASAPAYSLPVAPVKAGSSIMLVKKDGDGKNWNHNGNNKNWNKNGQNWSGNNKMEQERRQEVEQVRQMARRRSLPRRLLA